AVGLVEHGLRHFQLRLHAVLVENVGLLELLFEKALLVVPASVQVLFPVGEDAALGVFGEQCKIEALDGLGAFGREFGADAGFFFKAGNLVAAGAAVIANQGQALIAQLGIVHEGSGGIAGIGVLLGHQVAGDVAGFLNGKPEAGHDGGELDLQFMFAVGGAGVVQVKDEGLAEFRVVLRGQVLPSDRIVGAGALAGAVDPADQVIVVFLFADTGKIGGKLRAVRLVPFPDGMAAEAAARFAGGLALYRVAGGLMV